MEKGYIAFYKAYGPHSKWHHKLVDWKTGKKGYAHAEIILGDTMYSSSGIDGGVRKKPHKFDENSWTYVSIDIDKEKLELFLEKTKNDKYDWFAILGFIIPIKDRTHKWMCSEWCSNFIKIQGDDRMMILEPSTVSPNKFYEIMKQD